MKKIISFCFAFIASSIVFSSCSSSVTKNYSIGAEIASEMPLKNGQTLKYTNGTDIIACQVTMSVGSISSKWWRNDGDVAVQNYSVKAQDTVNRYINHTCQLSPNAIKIYGDSELYLGTGKSLGTDGKLICDTTNICLDTITVRNRRYNRIFTNKARSVFYTPEAGVIKYINAGKTYVLVPQ